MLGIFIDVFIAGNTSTKSLQLDCSIQILIFIEIIHQGLEIHTTNSTCGPHFITNSPEKKISLPSISVYQLQLTDSSTVIPVL
jgi:hypothetical protein